MAAAKNYAATAATEEEKRDARAEEKKGRRAGV